MERKQTIRNRVQFAVPCTLKVQKAMLKNLQAATRNKVNPVRAQKASAILAAISTETNSVNTQQKVVPIPEVTHVKVIQPAPMVRENTALAVKIKIFVMNMFDKFRTALANSIETFCLRFRANRINP